MGHCGLAAIAVGWYAMCRNNRDFTVITEEGAAGDMDKLQIMDSYPPLTSEAIDDFEREMAVTLPSSYRTFLLRYNAGRFHEYIVFPIQNSYSDSHVMLGWFYGIQVDNIYDLTWNKHMFLERMPPELWPIGCDPGGDQICISLHGANYGALYFWDHEFEAGEDEEVSYDNVYFVADSFDKFIDSLIPFAE